MRTVAKVALIIILLSLIHVGYTSATPTGPGCPKINGFIDFNCDGKLKITFTGDSIVKGVGDSVSPIEGYPGRIQEFWPFAEVNNLGVAGITSTQLIRDIKRLLTKKPDGNTSVALHASDIVVIAVGVNDYYNENSPGGTVGNIAQLVRYLKLKLKNDDGTAPLFLVSTLLPCRRAFQQPFITQVDHLLLEYKSDATLPTYVRFDQLDVQNQSLLNPDGLHPKGLGYEKMARIAAKIIKGTAQHLMAKQRSDKDADGLYDQIEPHFGTDKNTADTDGDGLLDGEEVFSCHTDPTKADTDGDTIVDSCVPPTPTPTPTPPPTVTPTIGM